MRTGRIVLCGGRSSRMGRPKAWLPFDGEPMLARVVRIVSEAVGGPVVVVAAPGQDVPPLPAGVEVVRDEVEGKGPLAGLAAGLAALEGKCDAAYLSSCDVPLLRVEFVRRVLGGLEGYPPPQPPSLQGGGLNSPLPAGRGVGGVGSSLVAVPRVGDRLHPLAAAYSLSVIPTVRAMLAADRLRMADLFDAVPTRFIGAEELAGADPALDSLRNVNTPEEYAAALRELGLQQPG